MPADELRKDAAKGMFWTGVQTLGSRLISMMVFVVLARLLEPSAFGVVALAAVAIALLSVFVEQGLGQALVQRKELDAEHCNAAFFASVGSGIVLAGLLAAVAGPVSNALGEPQLAPVLRSLGLILPITGVSAVPVALFRKRLEFRTLAERTIAGNFIGGVVGIAAAIAGFGVWSLVIQAVLGAVAESVLVWVKTDWRPGLSFSREHFTQLFGFGSRIMGSELLNFFSRNSDNLLIGAVLGPVALGLYSVAYRILLLMTEVLTRTIYSVALPVFSQIQDDVERMRRGFLKVTQMCASVALPCFALSAILAPEITYTVFGPQWHESVPVMQVLAFVGALQAILFFNTSVLMAMGKPNWVLRISALNAVCNVAAFAVAVHWGIIAVAASYTARAYLLAPISVIATKKVLDFNGRLYLKGLVGPVVATLLSVAVVAAAHSQLAPALPPPAVLVILAPVGLLSYLLILRVLTPGMVSELSRLILSGLPSFRSRGSRIAAAGGDI